MIRLLAPIAALGLVAAPAVAMASTKTKTTVKHSAKPAKKMTEKKTTTTTK